MRRRYVTRALAYVGSDDEAAHTANEVIVDDDWPTDTGLVDHMGNSIYRESVREPAGFIPLDEYE